MIERIRLNGLRVQELVEQPELITILKEEELDKIFDEKEIKIYKQIEKEKLLKLIARYGTNINKLIISNKIVKRINTLDYENLIEIFDKYFEEKILKEDFSPVVSLELKEKFKTHFLTEDAPEELKNEYYDLYVIPEVLFNPSYEKYYKNIDTKTLLNRIFKKSFAQIIYEIFGEDSKKHLCENYETIRYFYQKKKLNILKEWYKRTNYKYIPNKNFIGIVDLEEIDKLLNAYPLWKEIIKTRFKTLTEAEEKALIKLAKIFGVFDGDIVGFNKLKKLLVEIPRKVEGIGATYLKYYLEEEFLKEIKPILQKDGINFSSDKALSEYIYEELGPYEIIFKLNQQKYRKNINYLREYIEEKISSIVLNNNNIRKIFGEMEAKYNKEFRDFIFENIVEILNNYELMINIQKIQKEFQTLKIINQNKKVTLDMVYKYIYEKKYEEILPGIERFTDMSAKLHYNKQLYLTLREIYNLTRKRVKSSIPRVKGKTKNYNYEILRLDDPKAFFMADYFGNCQGITYVGDGVMFHSSIEANGRILLISDNEGNLIAESWLWRNGNYLCFDSLEVNDRLIKEGNNTQIYEELLNIIKEVSKQIQEKEEEILNNLFEENKITEEEYQETKLKTITLGIGENPFTPFILEKIKDQILIDVIDNKKPLITEKYYGEKLFKIYLKDSIEKVYIINEGENKTENTKQLNLYVDEENSKTKEEIDIIDIKMINSIKNEEENNISDFKNFKDIVNQYCLDENNTKIIISPNYILIYEEKEEEIIIADIFKLETIQTTDIFKLIEVRKNYYENPVINTVEIEDISQIVNEQIKLTLEQLINNKNINLSNLDESKRDYINNLLNIKNKIKRI